MSIQNQIETLSNNHCGLQMLPPLIAAAVDSSSHHDFVDRCVELIHQRSEGCQSTVLIRGVKGTWRTVSAAGTSSPLPFDLLADSLDQDSFLQRDHWVTSPLEIPNQSGRLIAQHYPESDAKIELAPIAAALAIADAVARSRLSTLAQADQRKAILEMTARWNQSRETDQLLVEIAEASTRLLGAERASIFLLQPDQQTLIGRPALGVQSGQIEISAGAGVVGSVVETGLPQRVDHDIATEQQQINRDVDAKLNFETRSLLCVPMINSANQVIGAFELINKIHGNFSDTDQNALIELAAHATVAIENTIRVEQLETTTKAVADEAADQVQLIGNCGQIKALKDTVERVANTDLAILITGENGTGKEVVAQLIHYLSDRRDKVLVAVNCAAITESLLESELFGHEKGAFTDAHASRAGKFELADQGTLFLDEIGDMSLGGQAKLLRVLEEKIVVRVGGSTNISTSARVVAATNQDLAKLVQNKKFREDLFFRLNVVTIQIPPLRDRGEDILLLAEHFLREFCKKARRTVLTFSSDAKKKLLQHTWPGNVRELRNMMERIAYLSTGNTVEAADLAFVHSPRNDQAIAMDLSLSEATRQFQCDYINRHIDRAAGNMTDAAGKLGLHRSNLYRKMRQLGMSEEVDDSDST